MTTPPSTLGAGVRKPLVVGIFACILAAIAAGAALAFSSPLFASADEAAHVDYAYQIWTGELPEFHRGLVIKPGFGVRPPVQWVAQHPPLYYLIQAPVVGPLIESGHYVKAGYAARAVNGLLAGGVVGAVAWAASQAFRRRPQLWLAAALVTALSSWVALVGGAVYNDLLAALVATLLLGLTIRSLNRGLTLRREVLITVAAAAALASRASLVLIVAGCLGVLVIHRLLVTRSWRRAVSALGRCTVMGVAAIVPSAWFYLRNERLTGHLLGSQPEWAAAHLGRHTRSTWDTLVDLNIWRHLTSLFSYGPWDPYLITVLLLWLPLALAVLAALLARGRSAGGASLEAHLTSALIVGTALATVAMQIKYTTGGGGANARYFLTIVLAVSLGIGYGLSQLPAAGYLLLLPWTLLAAADLVRGVGRRLANGPIPGADVYPPAAWAAVAVYVVAVTVALGAQAAMKRAAVRADRSKRAMSMPAAVSP